MAIERWTAPGDADAADSTLYLARCDDCNAIVAIAPELASVHAKLAEQRPDWRDGLPIFCAPGDWRDCAERTWLRYGRYMQSVIDSVAGSDRSRRGA